MYKRQTIPAESPYDVVNNDIGTVVAIDEVNRTFDVAGIGLYEIRDVLGESTDGLIELCTSNKINPWALFRPDGSAPYEIFDFAGYNHEAYPTTHFNTKTSTAWNATKASNLVIAKGFDIVKGEKPPTGSRSWSYVRVKVVLTDTLNNRTLTFYSAVQAVGSSPSTFIATYTDSINGAVQGSAVVTAEYVDSTGSIVYGEIEDTYPEISVNIGGYYVTLAAAEFASNPPTGAVRWYYVQANTPPYNNLTYIDYAANLQFHISHDDWSTDADLICARNMPTGEQVPDPHPGNSAWPLVAAVIYNSATGTYRVYNIVESPGNGIMQGLYKVDANMAYAYYLDYKKALSGWPSTVADLQ